MENKDFVKELLSKRDGKIVPSFQSGVCDGFYIKTKANLVKLLYAMSGAGELVKDFLHWTPKAMGEPDENNVVTIRLNGRKVQRKLRKDGTVAEAVFYLPEMVPEWLLRRKAQQKEAQDIAAELDEFEGLKKEVEAEERLF